MTSVHPRFAALCATFFLTGSTATCFAGVEQPAPVPVPAPASEWEFRLEPYAWLAGISGTTGVLNQKIPTDLSFSKVFEHLKMTLSGQLEVRKGRWGLMTDFFYADIGGFIDRRNPRIQQFAVDNKEFVFNGALAYRVYQTDKVTLDLFAGGRLNSVRLRITQFRDISLPFTAPNFVYLSNSQTKTWVDPFVGLRTKIFMTDHLFLAMYGDIGGFGVGSHLSWQVYPTVGWKFNRRVSAELGWRILSNNYTSGGFTYNVKQQGLYSGFNFTF